LPILYVMNEVLSKVTELSYAIVACTEPGTLSPDGGAKKDFFDTNLPSPFLAFLADNTLNGGSFRMLRNRL
jgi:hypothetical protein